MKISKLKNETKISFLHILLSNLLGTISGVLQKLLIVKYLVPSDYGILVYFNTLVSLINTSVDLGANNGALFLSTREKINLNQVNINKYISQYIIFTFIMCSVCSICILFYKSFLEENLVIYLFISIIILANCLNNTYQIICRVDNKFKIIAFSGIISSFVGIIITILLVSFAENDQKIINVIAIQTIIVILPLMWYKYKVKFNFIFLFDFGLIKMLIKIGMPLTIIPILTAFLSGIDKIILIKYLNENEYGIYALASTLGSILLMIPNSLAPILNQKFISDESDIKRININTVREKILYINIYMCFLAGLAVTALPIILKSIFVKYAAGIEIINNMILANLMIVTVPIMWGYLMSKKEKLKLINGIILIIISEIFAIILYYKENGASGIENLIVIFNSMEFILFLSITNKYIKINLHEIFCIFMPLTVTLIYTKVVNYNQMVDYANNGDRMNNAVIIFLIYSVLLYLIFKYIKPKYFGANKKND